MQAVVPRWSPDGKWIAFSGRLSGKKFKVYLISSEGGTAKQLMPEDRIEEDPNWSPDGNILVFAVRVIANSPTIHLHLLDLRTGQVSLLPGSEGLFGPRWSPEGRYIAAVPTDAQKLLLFDFTTRQWTELAKMNNAWSHWSRDGKYIYFSSLFQKDPALFRLRVEDRKVELLASLKDLRLGAGFYGVWTGLTADDSPLVLRDVGTQDIYALEWKAP
jgi:dipeptidyl aminopeptidase/acylaminoacyl peptidase